MKKVQKLYPAESSYFRWEKKIQQTNNALLEVNCKAQPMTYAYHWIGL
jgi:hypothetical protein